MHWGSVDMNSNYWWTPIVYRLEIVFITSHWSSWAFVKESIGEERIYKKMFYLVLSVIVFVNAHKHNKKWIHALYVVQRFYKHMTGTLLECAKRASNFNCDMTSLSQDLCSSCGSRVVQLSWLYNLALFFSGYVLSISLIKPHQVGIIRANRKSSLTESNAALS